MHCLKYVFPLFLLLPVLVLASNNKNLLSMCVVIIYVIIRSISFSAVQQKFGKCTEKRL